jgi:hypothetical protein
MKMLLATAAMFIGLGSALQAQPAPVAAPRCIRTMDIDRTTTPDDKTILFHMRGGRLLRSDIKGSCPTLRFNGFGYDATPNGEICGNLQIIRVLHNGAVCSLGPFVDVTPPPAPAPHM